MSRILLAAVVALVTLVLPARTAEAAPQVLASIFGEGGFESVTSSEPVSVSIPGGTAQADYNVSRLLATGAETQGTSAWRDEWTVSGRSGTGRARIYWRLTGSLRVGQPPTVCTTCIPDPVGATLRHLFGSPSITSPGTNVISSSLSAPGAQTTVTEQGAFDVTFTYGVPFAAGLRLSGGTGDDSYGGWVDFTNTGAEITGVELPAGSSLAASSGAVFNVIPSQTPSQMLSSLISLAQDAALHEAEPLLRSALERLQTGQEFAVCGQLGAFTRLVAAQREKTVSNDVADALVGAVADLRQVLNCR